MNVQPSAAAVNPLCSQPLFNNSLYTKAKAPSWWQRQYLGAIIKEEI